MVKKWLGRSYAFMIYTFLYLPIFLLIVFSFNDSKYRGGWKGFTLNWYYELFKDDTILAALNNTLIVALIAGFIATIIGTITAVAIHNMRPKYKAMFMNISYIPMVNPDIVIGVSLLALFVWFKLNLGYTTLILAHVTFNTPYVIFAVLPKLQQLNPHLEEAAMDLGASPAQAFFKVVLPELMPRIVTGALLSFTMSLDDFIVSFFTTGSGVSTLSIKIYSMTKRGVSPKINALTSLMFVAVLILIVILQFKNITGNKEEKE